MSLLWFFVAAVLFLGGKVLSAQAENSTFSAVYALVYQVLSLIPLAIFLWTVALESRFVYPFWQLHKNGVLFAFSYLPQTGLILLICLLAWVLCAVMLRYAPFLLPAMPAIIMALLSIPIEKIFRNFTPESIEE